MADEKQTNQNKQNDQGQEKAMGAAANTGAQGQDRRTTRRVRPPVKVEAFRVQARARRIRAATREGSETRDARDDRPQTGIRSGRVAYGQRRASELVPRIVLCLD